MISYLFSFAAYQNVKNKNAVTGLLDSYPQLTVKGVGYVHLLNHSMHVTQYKVCDVSIG